MKNIIFSNYDDQANPYYGGGGAVAIHEVAKRLAEENKVEVITGRYPGSKDEVIEGVIYRRIGPAFLGPKFGQLAFHFILPSYVKSLNFDIWFESFTPPFSTSFLQKFTKKPVVGLSHLLAAKNMAKKYYLPFDRVENIGLKTYKYFVVPTDQAGSKIRKVNPSSLIKTISNGLNNDVINADFEKKGEHVLFIGRIDVEQKGLDLLLKAICSSESRIKDKVLIAGSGNNNDVRYLKAKISEMNLQDKVIYIGKVSGNEKQEVFKKAKFLVLPSRFEVLPLALLEGFAFKCPVVMFDIDELKNIPDDISIKVAPFDYIMFGEAIADLSSNTIKLEEMQIKSKDFIKNFSWENVTEDYKELITEIA